jgi:hypothetical protein
MLIYKLNFKNEILAFSETAYVRICHFYFLGHGNPDPKVHHIYG